MHYVGATKAFLLTSNGFDIINLGEEGSLGDSDNSVLMQGTNFRDEKNTDIYEGDVLFFCRFMNGVRLPVVGIVNVKDFSFCINSVVGQMVFNYADKNLEVLGNIFEHSDEQLAKIVEGKIKSFEKK